MVDLNNERLLINLASGYLFGSGEDQLKSAGADALKHVGAILKDFPEYKVSVDGHTDNRPIRSELRKKFRDEQFLWFRVAESTYDNYAFYSKLGVGK